MAWCIRMFWKGFLFISPALLSCDPERIPSSHLWSCIMSPLLKEMKSDQLVNIAAFFVWGFFVFRIIKVMNYCLHFHLSYSWGCQRGTFALLKLPIYKSFGCLTSKQKRNLILHGLPLQSRVITLYYNHANLHLKPVPFKPSFVAVLSASKLLTSLTWLFSPAKGTRRAESTMEADLES